MLQACCFRSGDLASYNLQATHFEQASQLLCLVAVLFHLLALTSEAPPKLYQLCCRALVRCLHMGSGPFCGRFPLARGPVGPLGGCFGGPVGPVGP